MPAEYVDWYRMKVDDLPPREYWATAQEDMELATAIQQAVRQGERRADDEERQARENERKRAEQEKREKASLERLRARAGG